MVTGGRKLQIVANSARWAVGRGEREKKRALGVFVVVVVVFCLKVNENDPKITWMRF